MAAASEGPVVSNVSSQTVSRDPKKCPVLLIEIIWSN